MKIVCDCGAELKFEKCTVAEVGIAVIRFFDMHKHWPKYITFVCECGERLQSGMEHRTILSNVQRGMRDAEFISKHLRHKNPTITIQ